MVTPTGIPSMLKQIVFPDLILLFEMLLAILDNEPCIECAQNCEGRADQEHNLIALDGIGV